MKAVFLKEVKSELRTKYALSSLGMFVFTSVILLFFTSKGIKLEEIALSAVYWIIVFFANLTGLSRTFINEEERATNQFLILNTPLRDIYTGKLSFNVILSTLINLLTLALCSFFVQGFEIPSIGLMIINVIITGVGLAASTTILSALISKSNSKNSLLPVLAFPISIPLLILGADNTILCFSGASFSDLKSNLQVIASFTGVLLTASYLLFDFIYSD